MNKFYTSLVGLLLILTSFSVNAQFTVKGKVLDAKTKEPLIGAAVVIKGQTVGSTTDIEGNFSFKAPGNPPVVLKASFLGYSTKEITVVNPDQDLKILLGSDEVMMKEVKIVGTRVAQKLKESPVTIERMGIKEIKETPAVGFYEGLANLKGVDMTSASLGFKVINTRGFNSTSPVRTLQLIDGIDNQAPGLNFSLGNFVGASELDIKTVDIVVGANSATYGPNAFNGVISMTTKDPYNFEGLSASVKGAERNLKEFALRYAHVSNEMEVDKHDDGFYRAFAEFNNKYLKDRFAYKINGYYLDANDFRAVNYAPTEGSGIRVQNNLTGYDAVNIYGESRYGNRTADLGFANMPGMDSLFFAGSPLVNLEDTAVYVYRTGYREEDLTNYNTNSKKLQGGVYYKFPKLNNSTLSYYANYGTGTTVYQGDNRYSVKDIEFLQQKLELSGDNFFVRAYQTTEDAGNSYDLVFTATQLLQGQKEDVYWYADYQSAYRAARRDSGYGVIRSLEYARAMADSEGGSLASAGAYLRPGTPEFEAKFNEITSNSDFQSGGTRFADQSSLRHIEGQYRWDLSQYRSFLPETFKVGANYRAFDPNSQGTIFSDTLIDADDPSKGFVDLKTEEWGTYFNLEKDLVKDRLKLIASLRFDEHQNFDGFFTPSASLVISPNQSDRIRLTYTQASRFPTLQDQYLQYDIGIAQLKGNIGGTTMVLPEDYFGSDGYLANSTRRPNILSLKPIKQERVQTAEVGYKGVVLKNLYVDASYYYSEYSDFLGYIIGFVADSSFNSTTGKYDYKVDGRPTRVAANAITKVTTQGFSLGLNYYFPEYFSISANYTFAELIKKDNEDPLIPFFNTPRHKYNVGITMTNWKNFGANVTYRWVAGFDYFGSPQFTGPVDAYGLVDAQVNYTLPKINSRIKIGASNILNNLHFEAYGAPLIGRLAYASFNYDITGNKLNKNEKKPKL